MVLMIKVKRVEIIAFSTVENVRVRGKGLFICEAKNLIFAKVFMYPDSIARSFAFEIQV